MILLLLACYDPSARTPKGDEGPPVADDTGDAPGTTDSTDTDPPDSGADDSGGPPDTQTGDSGDTSDTGIPDLVDLAIDLVDPATGSTEGGDDVVLYGGPWDETAQVWFDGDAAAVLAWTATTLTVTTPPHAGEEAVDVVVETATGRGEALAAYAYAEPCEGLTATPGYTRTGNDDDEDVAITLSGCATGIRAVDELYTGYDGTSFGVEWIAAPSSVDGTETATLRYHHWSRWSSASSYYPYLETDQGQVVVEIDPR